jgi:hypothetical protein
MPELTSNYLAALSQITEKVAVELVYATPGRDDGLLPVNSLLTEMEEIGTSSPLLSPLPQAIAPARLVDSSMPIVEQLRVFDAARAHACRRQQAVAATASAPEASAPAATASGATCAPAGLPPEEVLR